MPTHEDRLQLALQRQQTILNKMQLQRGPDAVANRLIDIAIAEDRKQYEKLINSKSDNGITVMQQPTTKQIQGK